MSADSFNPYQSPQAGEAASSESAPTQAYVGTASGGRFLASQIDIMFAIVLFFVAAMFLADDRPFQIVPGLAGVGLFLGYYFLTEWMFGATPGKYLFGLRVRQITGEPCSASQIAIRTGMRIFEVNPLFLGGLPACIAILATGRRQRIGDLFAGTTVVRAAEID